MDLRALWAGALKEWRVMRRYPSFLLISTLFWPLVLPLMYLLQANGFAGTDPRAMRTFTANTGIANVAGFLFVGYAVYMWLSQVLWGPGTALRQQQVQGQLEILFLTRSARAAILFGPAISHTVLVLSMFLVVGLALRFGFGVAVGPQEALRGLAVVAVSMPCNYGIGTLFSSAVLRYREVLGLVQLVRGTFQVFCGMTFPIMVLPQWARSVAMMLPPTYIIVGIRRVLLTGADLAEELPDFVILGAAGVILCTLAVVAFRANEAYARRRGSLAQY